MNRFLLLLIVAGLLVAFTEETPKKTYPQTYFRSPIGHPIVLSGTFGELRGNHFHMGLDIKPKVRNKVGDPIYAIADGYVSRIKITGYGYGYGLYMTHPNGYTSVYGHLLKYAPKIAEYAKKQQYEKESFFLDINPKEEELFFKKGEVIGYLGTSGYSFGPHLHFEIRDTKTEKAVNPLLFGFDVEDTRKPFIQQLKVYNLDAKQTVISDETYNLKKGKNSYSLPIDTVYTASNQIGIGVKVYDQLNGASNWNGVYSIALYQDDSLWYQAEMETISFDNTRAINAHIDYKERRRSKANFNRCYVVSGNPLKIYKHLADNGIITLKKDQSSTIKLVTKDYEGNRSQVQFVVKQSKKKRAKKRVYNYLLPYHEKSIIKRKNLELHFEKGALYEDLYASIGETPDNSSDVFSPTFHIHHGTIPLHKPFEIKIKPTRIIPDSLKDKVYVAQCAGRYTSSYGGAWEGDYLKAKSANFGHYTIMMDTIPPTIKPSLFKENMTTDRISFIIKDKATGIQAFNAWVDEEWILMNYDGKRRHLYHDFDGRIGRGKHQLRLIVVDGRGNEAVFEREFIR